jgi:hypothetical protein
MNAYEILRSGNMDHIRAFFTPANINNLSDDDNTPLHFACKPDTPDNGAVIAYMIDCGARIDSINVYRNTALQRAVCHNKVACARVLLARGADPNTAMRHDSRVLSDAIAFGSRECVRLLMDYGALPIETRGNIFYLPNWVTSFLEERERVRHASITLMRALKKKLGRGVTQIIAQWVWSMRGCEEREIKRVCLY